MEQFDINGLEAQIDELLGRIRILSNENNALRQQQANLMAERATLIEKSEQARTRVESMISRLKSMEL